MTRIILSFFLAFFLFLCLLDMPYGYYQFVRFASMLGFAYLGYISMQEKKVGYTYVYFILALLFQPFFKVALGRTLWNIVDIAVGLFLLYSIFAEKRK